VKYAVLTFAIAALCLFAGWAVTNAGSGDAVAKDSGHAPAADESPAPGCREQKRGRVWKLSPVKKI